MNVLQRRFSDDFYVVECLSCGTDFYHKVVTGAQDCVRDRFRRTVLIASGSTRLEGNQRELLCQ